LGSSDRYVKRVRLRLALLGLASTLWVGALVGRLVYLQTVARSSLQERAELQQQATLKHDSTRGTIFDRNGNELAVSVEVESVYAVPSTVEDAEKTATALTSCLGGSPRKLQERLRSKKQFLWVKRKVSPEEADCVRKLELPAVDFLPEARRFYPKRGVAAHVLGFVGMDNEGMSGVEYANESDIRGEPGRQIVWMDARKRRAASRVEKSPSPGRDIYLTLDETLQHIAEQSLARAARETGSKRAMAILMRPETGEILAMAVVPGFNPNRYDAYPAARWRNRTVADAFEPGSTFKIIPAAAALEEGVASEEERIDCGRGTIRVGRQLIHDHKVFDVLTFREVLELSSNVGIIRIAQRLGKERLDTYIRRFGFGETTGVNLPAESRGLLSPVSGWGLRTTASIAFGQGIGVTPLQMTAAVNAIAASGYLMRPRLVREIRSPEGEVLVGFEPEPVRRVVSRETAARMRDILVGVVERGTGKRAFIPGYRVAGKTGTAEKAKPGGGYSKTDFIASFVGFVPAERPELTALVLLDSPSGDHSGSLAAGVFASIVEPSLHYLGSPPMGGREAVPVLARWPAMPAFPEAPITIQPRRPMATQAVVGNFSRAGEVRMPALFGLSARDAVARLVAVGLVPKLYGSGWVTGQDPSPGSSLGPGMPCTVILERAQRSGEETKIVDNRETTPTGPKVESVALDGGSS
jgi:cell division protein FtsI (penicillin-binding protein 3)